MYCITKNSISLKPPNPDVVRPNIKSQTDEISNDFVDVGVCRNRISKRQRLQEKGTFAKRFIG